MISLPLIVTLILGGLWFLIYWKAAEMDGQPCWLWAGLSAAVFAVTCFYFGWGWLTISLAQIALGVVIAVVRTVLEMHKKV